ncbi:MAG TPA: alanine--tRNA ligase, partial [Thermodesulfobacteriota bacterium]|nr:alanine--tRNA ligase [Thermodesulfobacteriota bacterium]
ADHSRAITFLINDGILPGNEGRGYVLRRILRRASYHGKRLGLHDPFLYRTCNLVVDMMQEAYPDLKRNRNYLLSVVKSEEERFSDTLDSGLKILHEEKERLKAVNLKVIPGDVIFKLYDTHGVTFDFISDIVQAEGLALDEIGFHQAMEEQRQRSRQFWKGSGEEQVNEVYKNLVNSGMKTSFVGYTTLTSTSPVLALIRDGRMVEKAQAGDTVEIVTEKTPFYGESGGQAGDNGVIESPSCTVEIEGAMKPVPDLVIHKGRLTRGELKAGDVVTLKVEDKKRKATALNHTATHLLQYALRKVLGDHVHQAGSFVSPERLRFDFNHFSPMTERELDRVEELINEKIRENIPVDIFDEIPLKKAQNLGATALFGEKYGEKVRVVKVGDYSLELCGGTHTHMTGDIGLMKIVTEGGVAAGVRRIEALTGNEAFTFVREKEKKLAEIAQRIKASPSDIVQKVTKILNEQKELQKEISALKGKLFTRQSGDILEGIRDIGGVKVLAKKVENVDPKGLREVADRLKEKIGSGIILLGAVNEDRVLLLARITDDLTPRFHAGKIVGEMAKVVGGSGGGRPDMAQAGGKTVEKLEEALETGIRVIEGKT